MHSSWKTQIKEQEKGLLAFRGNLQGQHAAKVQYYGPGDDEEYSGHAKGMTLIEAAMRARGRIWQYLNIKYNWACVHICRVTATMGKNSIPWPGNFQKIIGNLELSDMISRVRKIPGKLKFPENFLNNFPSEESLNCLTREIV
ncbi:hypothetical protein K435DRAFT_797588 [Dendrothele bispora CBS 962.96]|uniref:Uncharacterized protein n=1 Tax=Dendrothele bispora (strain CBS 962.96) TaxID=1314807 RepID=A0A4S8L2X9_DENBC|nr:hypothetical protein K435DRAFT_807973 [Dendrothele bispora CBS 962.96]THU96169.1 hypothetical protein K435DRAFT_797588 [Dendrothele bispora CBS 962.96]